MGLKILIAAIIAWFVGGFLLSPSPDPFSALVGGALAAFLCAVPLLILARFAFLRTASKPMHTLVCSLVCLVAILFLMCYWLTLRLHTEQRRLPREAASSPDPSVRVKNAGSGVPVFLNLAKDNNEAIKGTVRPTLVDIKMPEALPGLLGRLEKQPANWLVYMNIQGLGENGRAAGPTLVRYLSSDDWDVRVCAANALGYIGYTEAIPHLVKLLQTGDDWRQVYVSMQSLARLNAVEAIQPLTDVAKNHWFPQLREAAEKTILLLKDKAAYKAKYPKEDPSPRYMGYAGFGVPDDPCIFEEEWENEHPPYVQQGDHLDKEQLKKLTYKVEMTSGRPSPDGMSMIVERTETIERVPQVGIRVADGYLLGCDHGEFGGELVFLDSKGNQAILLHENVHDICRMACGIVVVTGVSHLMTDEGVLYQVAKRDDGAWHASAWKALPNFPITSGLLANGNLYVKCYAGSVEVPPSGNIKMAAK